MQYPYHDYTSALWKREFSEALEEIDDGVNSRRAAECLRFMIGTGLLAFDDMQNDPEKFFLTHRMIAKQVPRIGPCLWIRFALHYNVFAGSLIALGSPHQVKQFILRNEIRPSIGCLALNEAGCQNGVVVETTADLSHDDSHFILHTPRDSAAKTWISQGLVADEAIVIATLFVHNHSYGPQAFLIKLRDERGEVIDGITLLDMGPKDAAGDLDNARITFDQLRIPLSSHLCRFLEITNGTVRHPLGRKIPTMDVLGHSLYTGRVTVAQAALTFTRAKLEKMSDGLASNRICWAPLTGNSRSRISPAGGKVHLSKSFLSYAFQTLDRLDRFAAKIEAQLCQCLLHGALPRERLQQAISVLKVEAVETSIDICTSLQPNDRVWEFLRCCKFAEGNSRVLMQKMARDLARTGGEGCSSQVQEALDDLKKEMIRIQMGTGCKTMQAWERCGELVLAVAEAHMDSILRSYGCLMDSS